MQEVAGCRNSAARYSRKRGVQQAPAPKGGEIIMESIFPLLACASFNVGSMPHLKRSPLLAHDRLAPMMRFTKKVRSIRTHQSRRRPVASARKAATLFAPNCDTLCVPGRIRRNGHLQRWRNILDKTAKCPALANERYFGRGLRSPKWPWREPPLWK